MKIAKGVQEVWDSFEWLIREKLEGLDHLTRQMYTEMQLASGRNSKDVRASIEYLFADLWENVAAVEEMGKND
ncbi:hypothetical protein [Paenibacillus gorillae]|uniref:hypothetical protein n=1 Tax=Paenibacillus gorillae TaxID=1243662 RepID=UPI0004B3424D|nr:hypothetical protein [Paenibacillus gorillae]